MDIFVWVRYFHFLGIFLIVGSLFSEMCMVKRQMTRAEISLMSKVDSIYGLGAILTLAMGFLMWFSVGKPADFYTQNWIFHSKIFLYTVVGVLSIWPTVFFIKNRKGEGDVDIPDKIRLMIIIEVILIGIIPLLAILMSRGVGNF